MVRKARTPILEHNDYFAIELPGGDLPPKETDRLTDQGIVVAYDRLPGRRRWQLRGLRFDRDQWTRSGIRAWWAAHEVWLLPSDQLDREVPELCRSYDAPREDLPAILLCHRNTPLVSASQQIKALKQDGGGKGPHR